MQKDSVGFPVFNSQDIFDIIYQGNSDKIFELFVESNPEISQFNQFSDQKLTEYTPMELAPSDVSNIDQVLQENWFIPDEYKDVDVLQYLSDKCSTQEQLTRVNLEFIEYEQRGMIPLLKFLLFLVDTMKSNKIVWGVGRGSSVASYILYLIGVHRIDSLKYNLDFHEFMR